MPVISYPHTIRAFSTFQGYSDNKNWNTHDLNSTPGRISYLFQAEVTGSITQVCFKFQSATAASTGVIRVSIQGVTNNGSYTIPNGTILGSVNVSWSQATQAGTIVEAALGTAVSVTKGTLYHFVLEWISGATLTLGTWINTVGYASSLPGTTYWNGSAWVGVNGGNAQSPVFGYFIGQWYGNIYKDYTILSNGSPMTEGNVITFNTDASVTSMQLSKVSAITQLQTAFAITTDAVRVKVGTVSGTTYTDITTSTITTDVRNAVVRDAGSAQWAMEFCFTLPTSVSIPTNTPVYIGIEANGGDGNNRAIQTLLTVAQSAAHWSCWTQCPNGYFATLNGTTLTPNTLQKCWHNYHFDGITTSSTASGGGPVIGGRLIN